MDKTIINDEELDSQSQPEVEELLENIEDEEVKEKLQNHLKTLEIQRMKAKEKAEKLQKELEAAKNPQPEQKVETKPSTDDQWRKRMEFVVGKGRDLTADEVEEVISYAEGKGISYADALNTPFVKAALEKIREQRRAEEAAVETESSKSDIEKRFTEEQLKSMSAEELEKIIPKSPR